MAEIALSVGRNVSDRVASKAINVAENVVMSVNQISHSVENTISAPLNVLQDCTSNLEYLLKQVGHVSSHCDFAFVEFNKTCLGLLVEPYKICRSVISDFGGICSPLSRLAETCSIIANTGTCKVFTEISELSVDISSVRTSIEGFKDEFRFSLEVHYNFETELNTSTLGIVQNEFENTFMQNFDTFALCQRLFGIMIGCTVLHLLIRKVILVRNYVNGRDFTCTPISTFCLIFNPFMVQFLILALLSLLDYGIRSIYETQKIVFLHNKIELGANFDANVTNSGGYIGTLIADAFTQSFKLYDSLKVSIDLSPCFTRFLEPPPILSYLTVLTGIILGVATYKVDQYIRRNQELIIQFAFFCFDNIPIEG